MAYTGATIADVVIPKVFSAYAQELSTELSLLVQSGIIVRNPALDGFLAGGGNIITMPKWQDLGRIDSVLENVSANVSSTENTPAAVNNVESYSELGIRNNRNVAFGSRDLAAQLAGSDPMELIARRLAAWWVRAEQRQLNATMEGLINTDLAAGTQTLVNDQAAVAGQDVNTATDLVTSNMFLDTFQLLGDHKNDITGIVVHSVVHTNLQKANLIDFIPDSRADVGFGTYMGKTLIVDDGSFTTTRATASATADVYGSIVFGAGAFQYGVGSPRVSTEIDRNPLAGHGGGEEYIVNRREYVLHPAGFSIDITAGTQVTNSKGPSDTQLAEASRYSMVALRKNVPMAVLLTNG